VLFVRYSHCQSHSPSLCTSTSLQHHFAKYDRPLLAQHTAFRFCLFCYFMCYRNYIVAHKYQTHSKKEIKKIYHTATSTVHRAYNKTTNFKLMVPCIVIQCESKSNRCNSMQIFIYCKAALHVSGVAAPIIRSIKNCTGGRGYSF